MKPNRFHCSPVVHQSAECLLAKFVGHQDRLNVGTILDWLNLDYRAFRNMASLAAFGHALHAGGY